MKDVFEFRSQEDRATGKHNKRRNCLSARSEESIRINPLYPRERLGRILSADYADKR